MKTICEIKIELKAKGIKGITGKNKSQLLAMLEGKTPAPKPTKVVEQSKPNMARAMKALKENAVERGTIKALKDKKKPLGMAKAMKALKKNAVEEGANKASKEYKKQPSSSNSEETFIDELDTVQSSTLLYQLFPTIYNNIDKFLVQQVKKNGAVDVDLFLNKGVHFPKELYIKAVKTYGYKDGVDYVYNMLEQINPDVKLFISRNLKTYSKSVPKEIITDYLEYVKSETSTNYNIKNFK